LIIKNVVGCKESNLIKVPNAIEEFTFTLDPLLYKQLITECFFLDDLYKAIEESLYNLVYPITYLINNWKRYKEFIKTKCKRFIIALFYAKFIKKIKKLYLDIYQHELDTYPSLKEYHDDDNPNESNLNYKISLIWDINKLDLLYKISIIPMACIRRFDPETFNTLTEKYKDNSSKGLPDLSIDKNSRNTVKNLKSMSKEFIFAFYHLFWYIFFNFLSITLLWKYFLLK